MSTLPAASSFSGSADSPGTIGRTSSPTVLKSPCAIAVYSGAWSALGNQSSITVNGFVAGAERVSCFEPQALSARLSVSAISRANERRRNGLVVNWVSSSVSPWRQLALGDCQGVETGDCKHEQHRCGGICAWRLQSSQVRGDLAPEPRVRTGRGGGRLRYERADHTHREGDARTAERRRERRRRRS